MQTKPTAHDETPRRRQLRPPPFCPMCQSPRVLQKALLPNAVVCCCDECSAEFIVGPTRELDVI
jgi:hypothetical protein